MTKKNITHWLAVIIIGITLGLAIQFVKAWTEPTAAPPDGNVGAPINTGPIKQVKQGDICTTVTGTEICLSTASSSGSSSPCSCTMTPAMWWYLTEDETRSCGGQWTSIDGRVFQCTTAGWQEIT